MRATIAALLVLAPGAARAEVIRVTPADGYAPIERAGAGDEVLLAPGTYRFRVHLTRRGTPERPIVIRAEDPSRPPVWDLSGTPLDSAPGSYTGGDRGRGCWQVVGGAHYRVEGVVFTGCRNAARNAGGVRYHAGTTGLVLRGCVFRQNDNGLTGGNGRSDAAVEFCEFDRNGNASASAPTHNLYVYGGTFALRYSYVHDAAQAQNFHVRARASVIEYNWFARAASYEGDLMTDDDPFDAAPPSQSMLLRGNVFVQGAAPANRGQVVAVYNDGGARGLTLSVRAVHNTFVGNGGRAAFVHLSNADGTAMRAELERNVLYGTSVPVLVETASRATVTGSRNWLATGAAPGPLTASVFSASPGFRDAAARDFRPAPGSPLVGAAGAGLADAPDREYFRDEALTRTYRPRATARDLGAFESTTAGPGVGPNAAPDASAPTDADVVDVADAAGVDVATADTPAADVATGDAPGGTADVAVDAATESGGCGCRAGGARGGGAWWAALAALSGATGSCRGRRRPSGRGRGGGRSR